MVAGLRGLTGLAAPLFVEEDHRLDTDNVRIQRQISAVQTALEITQSFRTVT